MRTLNKTLCLVLALVMVLGMFGVATAADFTDDETIQYKEAVDVMTGIGSINGMGDGTFAPAGNVTRAQAAKMVAYAVLGADLAEALPVVASSFTDVDANFAWAIPSIEYLVQQGVINGRGDGTFDPNGEVTAYEIAKMLLVAAGYGRNDEFVGPSWALNVAIVAQRNGVFAGTKATDLNAAATREECALYCFTVLTAVKMVDKDYKPLAETLGELVYGLSNDDVPAAANEGLAANVWYLESDDAEGFDAKDTVIVTNALETIAATYKAGTKLTTIAADFGVAKTDAKYTVELYRNGVEKLGDKITDKAGSTFYIDYKDDVIPGGVTVDVVVPADEDVDLRLLINVHYLAQLTDVVKDDPATTADDRELVIAIHGYAPALLDLDKASDTYNPTAALPLHIKASDYANFDAIYAMVKDQTAATLKKTPMMVDVVPYGDSYTYTATQNGLGNPSIKSVALPTTVEGKISVMNTTAGTITVAGKTYITSHAIVDATGGLGYTATYKFVLDATGAIAFVTTVEEATADTDYAYALEATGNTSVLGTEWIFAINGEQVKYYVTNDTDEKIDDVVAGKVYEIKATTDDDDVTTYEAINPIDTKAVGTVTAISSKLFVATKDTVATTYNYADAYAVYDVSDDATVKGEVTTLAEGDTAYIVPATGNVTLVYVTARAD